MRANLTPGIRIALHTLSRTVSLILFVPVLQSVILIPGALRTGPSMVWQPGDYGLVE